MPATFFYHKTCGHSYCVLSLSICCACADQRPLASAYTRYVDGRGLQRDGSRSQNYCPGCQMASELEDSLAEDTSTPLSIASRPQGFNMDYIIAARREWEQTGARPMTPFPASSDSNRPTLFQVVGLGGEASEWGTNSLRERMEPDHGGQVVRPVDSDEEIEQEIWASRVARETSDPWEPGPSPVTPPAPPTLGWPVAAFTLLFYPFFQLPRPPRHRRNSSTSSVSTRSSIFTPVRRLVQSASTFVTAHTRREASGSATQCPICLSTTASVLFLPCAHIASCTDCVSRIAFPGRSRVEVSEAEITGPALVDDFSRGLRGSWDGTRKSRGIHAQRPIASCPLCRKDVVKWMKVYLP